MPTAATPPLLSVCDLRTYYHTDAGLVRAVDGVSFEVPRGGTVGIAGESGCGKTQTALSILGLIDGAPGIVGGQIWVDGVNLLDGLDAFCTRSEKDGLLTVEKEVEGWRSVHRRRAKGMSMTASMMTYATWIPFGPSSRARLSARMRWAAFVAAQPT